MLNNKRLLPLVITVILIATFLVVPQALSDGWSSITQTFMVPCVTNASATAYNTKGAAVGTIPAGVKLYAQGSKTESGVRYILVMYNNSVVYVKSSALTPTQSTPATGVFGGYSVSSPNTLPTSGPISGYANFADVHKAVYPSATAKPAATDAPKPTDAPTTAPAEQPSTSYTVGADPIE